MSTTSAPGNTPDPRAPGHVSRSDLMVALGLFAIGLTLISSGIGPFAEIPPAITVSDLWWHLIPLAVGCLGTTVQSRRPELTFGLATVALLIDLSIGLHMAVLGVWVNAVYAAGRYAPTRARTRIRWAVVLTCAAVALWVVLLGTQAGNVVLGTLQVAVLGGLALWLSGDARSGDDRAEVERRRTEQVRQRAVEEQAEVLRRERAHLAAQFHDTISSNLSSIALFTTGALDRAPHPERDRAVLREARTAALNGLTDMRALIDVLRSYDVDVDEDRPLETASLDEVVAGLEAAGLQVEVDLEPVDLSPQLDHALSQVAKESLTNALKHGDGRASVHLQSTGDAVELTVTNGFPAGEASARPSPAITGGIGLGSMAARVSEVGGRFRSGEITTGPERQWSVHAFLPVARTETLGEQP